MTRLLVTLVTLTLAGLALAGCGDSPSHPVAFVGDKPITREQLDQAIDQLRADRRRKGEIEEFPEAGSRGYRSMRSSVLALLVFRQELEQAAARLGVRVRDEEVEQRLEAGGGAPGEEEGGSLGRAARSFARESLRAQLLYDGIYARVTRGTDPAARRAAMARFIERMRERAKVRYEPGCAPGS
jgi:hypothetical protein